MNEAIQAKIEQLGYNGSPEETLAALMHVLEHGIKTESIRTAVLEELSVNTLEVLVQLEYC